MTLSIDGSHLTLRPAASAGPASTASWTAGQLLQAVVDSRSPDGAITLRLGSQVLEGRSDLPLRPGQTLTLQVTQAGTPLMLRIVPETVAGADGLDRALRQVLPRQGEIQPLLDGLVGVARAAGTLPPAVAAFASRLLSRLPDVQTLTVPDELKQALHDSGMFLEAHLAQGIAAPERDFKAALLQLQGLLRHVAPTLARGDAPDGPFSTPAADPQTATLQQRTDAAMARLVVNQIDSLPRDASATAPLVVELPLQWHDQPTMLRLHIEPDDATRHDGSAPPGWSVWLSFEPGDLGAVHCRLQLRDEQVSATFWAERETTATLFRENIEKLGSGFQQEGLTPSLLHCQSGKPPLPTARRYDLLDERA